MEKTPDFNQLLKVLNKEKPDRPVLFELFMSDAVAEKLAGELLDRSSRTTYVKGLIKGYAKGGYDYTSVHASNFCFPAKEKVMQKTLSANDGVVITDRESFAQYVWPDPADFDNSALEEVKESLPENMKLMVMGPGGVLENVTNLTGYDNLCYMLYEDPELVEMLFTEVGSRLLKYYEIALRYDSVGVIMSNDDWGFKSQTFLSLEHMRKYVFPWHKKIVGLAHAHGRPALLHSCGYAGDTMEDIIETIGFDGKHSYEDNILCVEESYKKWGGRIAVLGGMDIDFLSRSTPEEVKKRAMNMLALAEEKGGYALGSGNSIPDYIPFENYLAMIECR